MPRRGEIDPCWEALVAETRANPALERGKLNTALRAIREAAFHEGLIEDEAVAEEIRLRAAAYRSAPTFRDCVLTPMALATHWFRVVAPAPSAASAPSPTAQQMAFQQARMRADA